MAVCLQAVYWRAVSWSASYIHTKPREMQGRAGIMAGRKLKSSPADSLPLKLGNSQQAKIRQAKSAAARICGEAAAHLKRPAVNSKSGLNRLTANGLNHAATVEKCCVLNAPSCAPLDPPIAPADPIGATPSDLQLRESTLLHCSVESSTLVSRTKNRRQPRNFV
jgi:hypothetical protein